MYYKNGERDGDWIGNHGAAIAGYVVGLGNDDDNRMGLAFFTHGGTSANPRTELMRLAPGYGVESGLIVHGAMSASLSSTSSFRLQPRSIPITVYGS